MKIEEVNSRAPTKIRIIGRFKRIKSFAAVNLVIGCIPISEFRSIFFISTLVNLKI